ncbi:MAG: glycosyltransferase family 39 protein [Candidatus Omnitrophica bacterium]|nr:glycosyltransferase family 39 protein [Candidatus Omnitrophota bacterium]
MQTRKLRHDKSLSAREERWWGISSWLLLGAVLILILATFRHYGLTWDEELHFIYGERILRWYTSGFRDFSAVDYPTVSRYGGLFDLAAAVFSRIFPFGVYESRHLLGALFGFWALVSVHRLGSVIGGPAGGFFSALFLALTPVFYGHQFNNPKDIPFAALYAWALWVMVRSYERLPQLRARDIVALGVSVGLAAGVRIAGLTLLGYLGVLWVIWAWERAGEGKRGAAAKSVPLLAGAWACAAILAWPCMMIGWPWLQTSPVRNVFLALKSVLHFQWPLPVLYDGRYLSIAELPAAYLLRWFSLSLPEFYFLSLLAGGAAFVCGRSGRKAFPFKPAFLLFVVAAPVALNAFLHSPVYDGLRQYLFLVPPLAVLAGTGVAAFLKAKVRRGVKLFAGAGILATVVITAYDMADLHPYESVYFNRLFAGGLRGAAGRFDTDYWGSSYKEGAEWVLHHYRERHTEGSGKSRRARVANCGNPFQTAYFLEKTVAGRESFQTVWPRDNPDVFLAVTRWECHRSREGRVLHTVERKGVPLLYVIEPSKKPL